MIEQNSTDGRAKELVEAVACHSETLNFKVTPEFKKAFKGYAVSQGMTMIELLKEGFELSKQERTRTAAETV